MMTPPTRLFTASDALRVLLADVTDHLDAASVDMACIGQLLDSSQITRLARRRGFWQGFDLKSRDTLVWLLDEAMEQAEELTSVLDPVLEPPRGRWTRYGRKHGVFVRTPLDPTKCGTPAGYGAHRRRGQVACTPCKKAIAHYNAERQRQRELLAHNGSRIPVSIERLWA